MFTEKVLRFTFSGAKSGSFSAAGLRAAVNIQSSGGRLGSTAQVKIWGLSLPQMNAYSSKMAAVPAGVQVELFTLVIEAGDLGGQLSQVVNGPIFRSFIDLTGSPDSVFCVTMIDTYMAATPIAAQSQPGTQNAEDQIAAVCAAAGLTLDSSAGAHQPLSNPSTYGSAIDQIAKLAQAAKFGWKIYGTTVFIWPQGSTVDDTVIEIGPNTDPQDGGIPQLCGHRARRDIVL